MDQTKRQSINAENAKKSTGPRTAEGKARSRLNAVRHGMSSANVILPGEDVEAFRGIRAAIFNHWSPVDDVERHLINVMVASMWRRRRGDGVETGIWIRIGRATGSDGPSAVFCDDAGNYNLIRAAVRYMADSDRQFNRAQSMLLEYRKQAKAASASDVVPQSNDTTSCDTDDAELNRDADVHGEDPVGNGTTKACGVGEDILGDPPAWDADEWRREIVKPPMEADERPDKFSGSLQSSDDISEEELERLVNELAKDDPVAAVAREVLQLVRKAAENPEQIVPGRKEAIDEALLRWSENDFGDLAKLLAFKELLVGALPNAGLGEATKSEGAPRTGIVRNEPKVQTNSAVVEGR